MTDVVVRLPIRDAAEDAAFGSYLARFLAVLGAEALRLTDTLDAPWLMARNEPQLSGDLRIVTFQECEAAQAFTAGWCSVRSLGAPSA